MAYRRVPALILLLVVMSSLPQRVQSAPVTCVQHVIVSDAEGGNQRVITKASGYAGSYYGPRWSPNSNRLVYYTTKGEIILWEDGKEQLLTYGYSPEWAQDGSVLYFSRKVNEVSQIFSIRADGTEETQLTRVAFGAWRPSINFTGDTLVISVAKSALLGPPYSLYKFNTSTRSFIGEVPAEYKAISFPSWSSDNALVVEQMTIRPNLDLVFGISVLSPTGTLVPLTPGPRDFQPRVQEDGTILFTRGMRPLQQHPEVMSMDADGKNLRHLVYGQEADLSPLRPDGSRQLAFSDVICDSHPAPETAIEGSVTDQDGTPLRGVTVEVHGREIDTTALTDENGNYTVPDLPTGDYMLRAVHPDWQFAAVQRVHTPIELPVQFKGEPVSEEEPPPLSPITPEITTTVVLTTTNYYIPYVAR